MAHYLRQFCFDRYFNQLPIMLRNFAKLFNFLGSGENTADEFTVNKLIDNMKERKYDHIIFMVGAGISTCELFIFFKLENFNVFTLKQRLVFRIFVPKMACFHSLMIMIYLFQKRLLIYHFLR